MIVWPGDSGPNDVAILVSNTGESGWSLINKKYTCNRQGSTRLVIPSEYLAKYVRISCLNNVRGGQIVSVRYVMVKGLNR